MHHTLLSYVIRAISPEDGKKLAEQWKAAFLETSAKENQVNLLIQSER